MEVTQPGPTELLVRSDVRNSHRSADLVRAAVERVLMLSVRPCLALDTARKLDTGVANLLERGAGRFLRGSSSFEDAVKTVCTINTSWQNTISMVTHLVEKYGVDGAFPTPNAIGILDANTLAEECRVGYRATTILLLARLAVDRALDDLNRDDLIGVRGLGPYAVDHIGVLRGDLSQIPVDSEVLAYCEKELGLPRSGGAKAVHQHFSQWGHYCFIGYKLGRIAKSKNWIGN